MKNKSTLHFKSDGSFALQLSQENSLNMKGLKQISAFLVQNAQKITVESASMHKKEMNLTEYRWKKVQLLQQNTLELVLILSENLRDISKSKHRIEQASVRLAEEAIKGKLTIEEAIDSQMFLKKSIFNSLENSSLLGYLEAAEMYMLGQSLSRFTDIVASQIAFAFHYQFIKNQDQLRQSEEKFSKVFELGPGAFTITELSSGKIVNANEKFLKMTGYSLNDLVGNDSVQAGIFIDSEAKQAYKVRRELLSKTGYLSDYFVTLKTNEGKSLQVKSSSVVVQINGTEHVATSYSDVSEALKMKKQKETYKALHTAHEELKKIAQAKEQFIGIASHQLRTPATAVKQYIGMMLFDMSGNVTKKQRQFLEKAYSSNERQIMLINDLLKTAQLDIEAYSLKKQESSIGKLIKKVITQLGPILETRNQSIEFIDHSKGVTAHIDPVEIDLVFSNLIENASKYSPDNTKLVISIECFYGAENFVEVAISDQGVGIDNEFHVTIFDKFTRVVNERSTPDNGTGLGLYWVKTIVDMHGGKVIVESKKGEGSVFKVRLPL